MEDRAEFIIQINLVHPAPTSNKLGCITLWDKSGDFGHADKQIKFCPMDGCLGFHIEDDTILSEQEIELLGNNLDKPSLWPEYLRDKINNFYHAFIMCDMCGCQAARGYWADKYVFKLSIDKLAARVTDFFRLLDSCADIYLVRSKHADMFSKAAQSLRVPDTSLVAYEKMIEKARNNDQVFYQLKNIIKDLDGGSSLESRVKFLLEA